MCCLREPDDPRKLRNGTLLGCVGTLVIAMAAVLSDCDTVEDIAFWGLQKKAWLRRFLVLKNGIPFEETFLRVLRALDPKQLEVAFTRWVGKAVGALYGGIAVSRETTRGSGGRRERAIHIVSAFATEPGVVLGQEKIGSESNEITAIQKPLSALNPLYSNDLRATIGAMSCQTTIAHHTTGQGGDYPPGKGSQLTLLQAIETEFIDQYQSKTVDPHRHRRARELLAPVVGQIASVLPVPRTVELTDWPQGKRTGLVRKVGDEESTFDRRYYFSARALTAIQLGATVRGRWGIVDRLHWVLYVSSGEHATTVRQNHAPENIYLFKKIVLNLIRLDTTEQKKPSLRLKRKRATRDDAVPARILNLRKLWRPNAESIDNLPVSAKT